MVDANFDRSALSMFAGLSLGIMIGGPLGPIVFGPLGLSIPAAATTGSFAGAVFGFLIVAAMVRAQRVRRERELRRAAEAVREEAHLPSTIQLRVDGGRVILDGVVANEAERRRAKEVFERIPGVMGVVNRIRMRTANGEFATAPGEIQKEIEDRLRRAAEEDARGIRVLLDRTRVVLEGRVRSWAEASAAEETAWGIPGITEVVNRLEIAA